MKPVRWRLGARRSYGPASSNMLLLRARQQRFGGLDDPHEDFLCFVSHLCLQKNPREDPPIVQTVERWLRRGRRRRG